MERSEMRGPRVCGKRDPGLRRCAPPSGLRAYRAAAGQSAGLTSAQGRPAPAARAVSTWTHPPIASRPCTLVTSKVADIGGSYHTGPIQSALSTAPALGNDPAV